MPEWEEICDGIKAAYLRVAEPDKEPYQYKDGVMGEPIDHNYTITSGSLASPWDLRVNKPPPREPLFWTCIYCRRGNQMKEMSCVACGSSIGESVKDATTG